MEQKIFESMEIDGVFEFEAEVIKKMSDIQNEIQELQNKIELLKRSRFSQNYMDNKGETKI